LSESKLIAIERDWKSWEAQRGTQDDTIGELSPSQNPMGGAGGGKGQILSATTSSFCDNKDKEDRVMEGVTPIKRLCTLWSGCDEKLWGEGSIN